jgi:hypothetical protein
VTELDLMRLGRHVAEREDAALAADDAAAPSENTRRYLAEYAARAGGARTRDAAGARSREGLFGIGRLGLGLRSGPGAAPRAARIGLAAMAAVVVGVALLALKGLVLAPAPLSFTIGSAGERGVLRNWESAPDDASVPIRFSDGTRVVLEPRARARVVAVSERGAEIVIESGRAHVDVVPVRRAAAGESPWRVSLGPFSVEVKGTRFDVEWDPRTDAFALDLFEGSVRVSGCQEGHAHTLVAGQGVRASCSQRRWELVSASEANSAAAAPAAPPNAVPAEGALGGGQAESEKVAPAESRAEHEARDPIGRGRASRSLARAPAAPRSWQALALRGHYAEAFERALDAGFETECERVGASDLVLLGDAARLGGDAAHARAAYLAARRRFEGSAAAAQAAFGLGRLAVKSAPRDAIDWFERSLREAPRGPLAAAAHDWLFELVGDTGSPARRREVAKRYLEQHPDGAHAEDARRIIEDSGR